MTKSKPQKKYAVAVDYGSEGYSLEYFETLREALEYKSFTHSKQVILKVVDYEVIETEDSEK